MKRHLTQSAVGLLFALCASLACVHTPAIGEPCQAGAAYCYNPHTALACRAGKIAAYACTGPGGCSEDAAGVITCNQGEKASAGLLCLPEYEGKGQCQEGGTDILQCTGGTWAQVACPAGTACQKDADDLICK